MIRPALGLAAFLALARIGLGAAPALACDEAGCRCHRDALGKAEQQAVPLRTVEKCKCEGRADCTCKKGHCKCSKCQLHHREPARSREA